MRLFGTPGSPFVRKVRIVLEEKRIPHEYIVEHGSAPGSRVPQFNPLGKIPVLVLDGGRAIYDSSVIVEYLDGVSGEPRLIPAEFEPRIEVKRWEALGDGIAEATVAISHEYREPKDKQRSAAWFERQRLKVDRGLAVMAKDLGAREFCFGERFSLADIATVYALGYLDYALPEVEWRGAHPDLARFAERMAKRDSCARTVQT
ncbi:MAG: glutathione S-transferase N-terminal domain-containing protein [Betaproteobacteria bacterium]|nr:glutathione S-transferase N-terminal domain-containing protein [Betaproteobacteria bacterium]